MRVMTLLQDLQDEADVTLATGEPFECERLNAMYHTNVSRAKVDVSLVQPPGWLRGIRGGDAFRSTFFARHIQDIGPRFDLCVSTYNFMQFGRPAIQFIADFTWDDALRWQSDPRSPGLRGLFQQTGPLRNAYLSLVRLISGLPVSAAEVDSSTWKSDLVVANSRWTANLLAERYGVASRVIYPPVHVEPFDPAAPRTGDFVMLGRIAPEKRIEEAMDILARVRARGHQFKFHILGPLNSSPYSLKLRMLAQQHGDWVCLRGGVYGPEKFAELARHSFAIHTRMHEAFGIAVAEQVKMGLIPFVRAHTAPAEIVDEADLCFDNADHAVEIIDRVLRSPQDHLSMRKFLAVRGQLFSREYFVAEARELVREALAKGRNGL